MRPVPMTAIAMSIGIVPVTLGLGDRGEQSAPSGRALIGRPIFAPGVTLFFVPSVFILVNKMK